MGHDIGQFFGDREREEEDGRHDARFPQLNPFLNGSDG